MQWSKSMGLFSPKKSDPPPMRYWLRLACPADGCDYIWEGKDNGYNAIGSESTLWCIHRGHWHAGHLRVIELRQLDA